MSLLDKNTNLISLINVVEELTVNGNPDSSIKAIPPLDLVTLWTRPSNESGKGFGKASFVSPTGEVLKAHEYEVDLTSFERLRVRVLFQDLRVSDAGVYQIRIEYKDDLQDADWNEVYSFPLVVKYAQ